MQHLLISLEFTTPVRFGGHQSGGGLDQSEITCYADTFFSALCHETLNSGGSVELNKLVDLVMNDQLLISDLFPFYTPERGEEVTYYLPKPILPEKEPKHYLTDQQEIEMRFQQQKKIKKQNYVPAQFLRQYVKAQQRSESGDLDWEMPAVAVEIESQRVGMLGQEKSQPYLVSAKQFFSNKPTTGLYLLMGLTDTVDQEWILRLVKSAGLSGIGGKRSTGYGRFEFYEEPIQLFADGGGIYDGDSSIGKMLNKKDGEMMALSVTHPLEKELALLNHEASFYQLVNRSGFVWSVSYADQPLKRKPVTMIKAGSVFPEKMRGCVVDTAQHGNHPVYRYGKGFFLGVNPDD